MKSKLFFSLFIISFIFATCTKEHQADDDAQSTSLEIFIKDENGNPVTKKCYVKLFATIEDWADPHELSKVGEPQFPDAEGKVVFSKLKAQTYFWKIENIEGNGCTKNNFNQTYYDMGLATPLTVGEKKKLRFPLVPKATTALLIKREVFVDYM